MTRLLALFAGCVLLLAAKSPPARVIHVPGDAATIQGGLDLAVSGDTVLVGPGTYEENVSFNGQSICLLSEKGPEETLIRADGGTSVVRFTGGEDGRAGLIGFAVEGSNLRRALVRGDYASPRIEENLFRNDPGGRYWGVAIINNADTVFVRRNQVLNNTLTNEGCHFEVGPGPVVYEDNWIDGAAETALAISGDGGGRVARNYVHGDNAYAVYARDAAFVEVENNYFTGSGVCFIYTSGEIHRNIIVGATYGIDVDYAYATVSHNVIDRCSYAGLYIGYGNGYFYDNIITNCATGITNFYDLGVGRRDRNNYWNVDEIYPYGGEDEGQDSFLDPRFVDPAHGDYRLRADSPLLDQARYVEEGRTVVGPAPDCGVFEFPYAENPGLEVSVSVTPDSVDRGDSLSYSAGVYNSSSAPQQGDFWLELVGKHTQQVLAAWSDLTLAPGATWSTSAAAAAPDKAVGGYYRLKARWGRRGEEIAASAVADLELDFKCVSVYWTDLYLEEPPREFYAGTTTELIVAVWNDCAEDVWFDRIETVAEGPTKWEFIPYEGEALDAWPEAGRDFLLPVRIPLLAPPGVYRVTTTAYLGNEVVASSWNDTTILPPQ